MSITRDAEILLIEGPDAVAFAHAQFSSKVTGLAVGRWAFGAWLDPQGRVRALFHLARIAEEKLLLLLRGGTAADMADGLRRFVFRSRVTLHAASPAALATGEAQALHDVRIEGETISLGCGEHALRIVPSTQSGDAAWRKMQLKLGWPWLPEEALDKWVAPMLSLQRLQAVAVDKGCYPGQEIVARLHFRGGCKRHLCHLTLSRAIAPGLALRVAGQDAGMVLDVVDGDTVEALAVLNDDITSGASDGSLSLDHDEGPLSAVVDERWPA
ncbi:YgfZ/GcvT domain-containing protein [Rhodanobacter caeni]|uniref:Folate-binding protein YgfZ n=1 Tax=Rhodanobacter caeni TaxID=657654 RepID=A0ABN0UTG7_9GAMM